jgi:hypothetical protein
MTASKSNQGHSKVILHDMCLRDGMHAKHEQISVQQMVDVATALDRAGVATPFNTASRRTRTRNTSKPSRRGCSRPRSRCC